jgi:hypothetical protein
MAMITIYGIGYGNAFSGELEYEVADPVKSPIPAGYTHASPYPIPDGHYAMMAGGWKYVQGEAPVPPPPDYSAQNKQQAQALLQATDWTCTVDINNPQYSNPYLANQDEFLTYRSQVRQVAVNPPIDPVTFPPQPDEVWASV